MTPTNLVQKTQIHDGNTNPDSFSKHKQGLKKASLIGQKMSASTKFKLKVLASIILVASLFIFGKVNLGKTWELILSANPIILLITACLFLLSFLPMARRWQILACAIGFQKPLSELLKYYFVGTFFNLFLPSTVGGDVSRCYYLSKGTNKYKASFYSVFADRASGVAVLFLTATVAILISPKAGTLPWALKWPIYLGTFGTFIVLPLLPTFARIVLGSSNWFTRRFSQSVARVFWQDKPLIVKALIWSIVSQVILVLCHIGVGLALGLTSIPLWYYFVFYPAVAVLGFVTPSFNGIGVREWAYRYFLLAIGVDNNHAVTYALLLLVLNTFGSLVGGIVYMMSHMKPPPKEVEEVNI